MAVAGFEMIAARLRKTEANLAMVTPRLKDSFIIAFFSGSVAGKFSNKAEIVLSAMPSGQILWLMNINRMKVEIPDVKMPVTWKGPPVDVTIDVMPQKNI